MYECIFMITSLTHSLVWLSVQYAPWCVWCQKLEPVWEAFAERLIADGLPTSVVKVDCIANRQLCAEQKIQAFPTLRLFKQRQAQPPDYKLVRVNL